MQVSVVMSLDDISEKAMCVWSLGSSDFACYPDAGSDHRACLMSMFATMTTTMSPVQYFDEYLWGTAGSLSFPESQVEIVLDI